MTILSQMPADWPAWLPGEARLYLAHVRSGRSIRELARSEGVHPSTILRRVRAFELRRDDPLVDAALCTLEQGAVPVPPPIPSTEKETAPMSAPIRSALGPHPDAATLAREARRILRRLCEPGALLAVAPDMDMAAVLKGTLRTAVVERTVAQAFALKDWIAVKAAGRVTTHEITPAGRAALKRILDEDQAQQPGLAEARAPFGDQHRVWDERAVMEPGTDEPRKMRYNLAESPFAALARRRDKDGKLFLEPDLVAAGERLREDFELAQMGPRVTQNWDRFLTAGDRGALPPSGGPGQGPGDARARVAAALRDLGPGLGDVVLRCCCFLEGLEVAEKRMGWSARSGKIVLRIALIRLKRHYDEVYGGKRPLIG